MCGRVSMMSVSCSLPHAAEEGRPINRPQFIEVLARAALIHFGSSLRSMSAVLRAFAEEILGGRILQVPLSPWPRMIAMMSGEYFDILLARRRSVERWGAVLRNTPSGNTRWSKKESDPPSVWGARSPMKF